MKTRQFVVFAEKAEILRRQTDRFHCISSETQILEPKMTQGGAILCLQTDTFEK